MSAELHAPAPDGILAYVDEDGTYDHVLRVGRTLARETESALILYESTPPSALGAPAVPVDLALGPDGLLQLHRGALAEAVFRARGEGIDAWGWVAVPDDPDALATCVREVDVSVIVLPAEIESGSLPERWRDDRLEIAEDGSVSLVIVDRAGHLVGPA